MRARSVGIALSLTLGLTMPGIAQSPPGPQKDAPPKVQSQDPPAKAPAPDPRAQIRVRVELVNTPVAVYDRSGELVLDLTRDDFRVFDQGVQQQIESFDLGGTPLSLAVVVETSKRIEGLLEGIRKSGILITETIVALTGEAAVLTYDDTPVVVQPMTTDKEAVLRAFNRMVPGNSGAKLYDAMARGVSLLKERPRERRRVMLVIAEPLDRGSEMQFVEVLREAQLNNIAIYTVTLSTLMANLKAPPDDTLPVQITPPGTFGRPPIPGTAQTPTSEMQRSQGGDLLNAAILLIQGATNRIGRNPLAIAATATGGMNLGTFKERTLEKALDMIGGQLHAEYTITYRPTGVQAGGYHEIKIQVARPGLTVRARPGYYLPPS